MAAQLATPRQTMKRPITAPTTDIFRQALKGGETWAKQTVKQLPTCSIPVHVTELADSLFRAFLEHATEPKFTVESVVHMGGTTYWTIQPSAERVRSANHFAPSSIRLRSLKQRMHIKATLGNLRILLHSVLAVTVATTIERRDGCACVCLGEDVKRVVIAAASRPTMWAQQTMLVEDLEKRPTGLHHTSHLTVWMRKNGGTWVEVDLCDARGPQFHQHDTGPAEPHVSAFDSLVQSRFGAELKGATEILDRLVATAAAHLAPKTTKRRRKKKKRKKTSILKLD